MDLILANRLNLACDLRWHGLWQSRQASRRVRRKIAAPDLSQQELAFLEVTTIVNVSERMVEVTRLPCPVQRPAQMGL